MITSGGVRLRVGAIPRSVIDSFLSAKAPPEPPMRVVQVWGGVEEEVYVYDDPQYLKALSAYQLEFFSRQIDVIAPAIEIDAEDISAVEIEASELFAAGLCGGNKHANMVRIALKSDADIISIVGEVFYLSTVTERGIAEAYTSFNVKWRSLDGRWRDASDMSAGTSWDCKYAPVYEAKRAANFQFISWDAFCEMGGPQQSEVVAFYRMERRLQWLESARRRR